jgi:membrane peptidoglycan carboxypeptidase
VKPSRLLATPARHVIDSAHAYEITDVLADNAARCTVQVCEFGLDSPLKLDRIAAAKTGTTNSFTDNWTVGYTPQIVTGVWVGNADRSAMRNVIGVTGAAPIWHNFMEKAFKTLRLPPQPFARPKNVILTNQCSNPSVVGTSYGATDLAVTPLTRLPLCALPDRGFMPSECHGPLVYTQFLTPVPCQGFQITPQNGTGYQYGTGLQNGTGYPYGTGDGNGTGYQYGTGNQYGTGYGTTQGYTPTYPGPQTTYQQPIVPAPVPALAPPAVSQPSTGLP